MADAAARREERRRKITQNAEARMNKLLGKQTAVDSSPSEKILPTSVEEVVQSTNTDAFPDAPVSSSPYNLRHRPSRLVESNSKDSSPTPRSDGDGSPGSQSNAATPSPAPAADTVNNIPARQSVRSTLSSGEANSSPAETENNTLQTTVANLRTLEMVHIGSCVFTALVARYVLTFGIGLFYFQTIVLPFIVMELTLAYLSHTQLKHLGHPSPKGTVWSAALMLCGIKQELIDSYNVIMSRVAATTNNFCCYLFSFIIWNAVIG
ncbi:uncharacterized protein LOC101860480 [Aplysia californica]|uniref:Uncharacterized protein LOC101860480 n=1 Tax=Aplysia californica TaxID=6500 RepID=A0ABM0JG76_APLCA|nr:uncharacterized protein LOC101860480 [Aplysia californica]